MPPDRNTPSGTSLISSLRTDSRSTRSELLAVLFQAAPAVDASRAPAVEIQLGRPVAAQPVGAVRDRPGQGVRRRQLADPAHDASRRGHELVGEVLVQRRRVDAVAQRRVAQQRLELGREHQALAVDRVVERLDPHPVARQQEDAARAGRAARTRTSRSAARPVPRPTPRSRGPGPRCRSASRRSVRRRRAASAARGGCRSRRSATTQIVESSLCIGWWPPSTSMIDRRRMPSVDAVELNAPLVVRSAMHERRAHALDQLAAVRRIAAGDPADPAHQRELADGWPPIGRQLPYGPGVRSMISRTT